MTNTTITTEAAADLLADPRPALADAMATCGELLHALRPLDLDRPTPCTGMDVRELAGHLVMVAQRIACAARSVPTYEWPSDVTGLADDEWAPAWNDATADAVEAWAHPALLDQHMVLPWAEMSGREVVGIYTNEVIVHSWDLAHATDQTPRWSQPALEVALVAVHSQLPDADRAPMWAEVQSQLPEDIPWEDPFANAVPVADDAPLIDRVVAWNGRRPATATT